jgi:5-methylcytosine-specific restriction endonuclease McrA
MAFCQMATNVATGLEIEGEDRIRPVSWEEWIQLPIRPQDSAVQTVRGPIRVPTVIVAVNFARVPRKRPRLCARGIRERDGNRCQYTGVPLKPEEGSNDHVVPRSRGGRDS